MSASLQPENILESGKHLQVYLSIGTVPEVVTSSTADFSRYCKDNFNVDVMDEIDVVVSSSLTQQHQSDDADGSNDEQQQNENNRTENKPKSSVFINGLSTSIRALGRNGGGGGGDNITQRQLKKANALKEVQEVLFFSTKNRKIDEEIEHTMDETNAAAAVAANGKQNFSSQVSINSLKSISQLCHLCQEQAKEIELLKEALSAKNQSLAEEGPRSALVAERGRNLLLSAELEDAKEKLRESEQTVQEFAGIISELKADVRQLVEMHSVGDFHGNI